MIPIFIKNKSFGLVGSVKLARIHFFKNHFHHCGALQEQVRKNFKAKSLLSLEKGWAIPKQKRGQKPLYQSIPKKST
jgi:hypothetical protein